MRKQTLHMLVLIGLVMPNITKAQCEITNVVMVSAFCDSGLPTLEIDIFADYPPGTQYTIGLRAIPDLYIPGPAALPLPEPFLLSLTYTSTPSRISIGSANGCGGTLELSDAGGCLTNLLVPVCNELTAILEFSTVSIGPVTSNNNREVVVKVVAAIDQEEAVIEFTDISEGTDSFGFSFETRRPVFSGPNFYTLTLDSLRTASSGFQARLDGVLGATGCLEDVLLFDNAALNAADGLPFISSVNPTVADCTPAGDIVTALEITYGNVPSNTVIHVMRANSTDGFVQGGPFETTGSPQTVEIMGGGRFLVDLVDMNENILFSTVASNQGIDPAGSCERTAPCELEIDILDDSFPCSPDGTRAVSVVARVENASFNFYSRLGITVLEQGNPIDAIFFPLGTAVATNTFQLPTSVPFSFEASGFGSSCNQTNTAEFTLESCFTEPEVCLINPPRITGIETRIAVDLSYTGPAFTTLLIERTSDLSMPWSLFAEQSNQTIGPVTISDYFLPPQNGTMFYRIRCKPELLP